MERKMSKDSRFEVAIMVFQEPDKLPERVNISTATKAFQGYASTVDKYAETGNRIKVIGKPLKQTKGEWESEKDSIPMVMVFLSSAMTNSKLGHYF